MKVKQVSELKKRNNRRKLSAVLFMMPSLLGVFVFFILPFFVVIYYSMVDNPISASFAGFDNFVRVFGNAAFKRAGKNTLQFSFIAMPLSVLLSLLLAIMLDRKIPLRSQFRTAFLTPMMVPVASIVLIVQVMFHYNGAVNNFFANFGVPKTDWLKSDYAQVVIIFLFLWKNLGYNMILFLSALEAIPRDILEVAYMENASPLQIFWMIKIRYLSPTILFVTILSLINSFKVFREIYLLTSDHPVGSIYMLQHFMNNTFKDLDYQKLSAAAIIMSLVMIVIIGALFLVENRFGKDVEE
ncbi:MAG: sugar ABC transporter permease [Lachnospiraceae bacterium]|nr:sugar ABC transporter permease [Lachnospiraceae bacterium]